VNHDQPLYIRSNINDAWKSQKGKFQKPKFLRHRVRIYLLYSVPSFHRQLNQNFEIWLKCRPGPESQKEMRPFMPALEEAGVQVTFDQGAELARSLLDDGLTHAHVTRIDSDDMLNPRAVGIIRDKTPERFHSLFIRGYVWTIKNKSLMRIHHPSPPCYTLYHELDPNKGPLKHPGYHGHTGVRKILKPKIIGKRLFLMTRHGKHVGGGPLARGPKVRNDQERQEVMETYWLQDPMAHWEERGAKAVLELLNA